MNPSRVTLNILRAPVADEFQTFERLFREALRSRIGLLDIITRYIVRQKGKRVRPLLVLLSAKVCGSITDATYRGAALVEILHTATLVHDDVVDDADTRRGFASINAVWKNKVAVLLGDYLLSRGLLLSLDSQDYGFLHSTSMAVKRMSEGELLQIQKSRQFDITEETYLQIIGDKTASLFATCTEVGAISATPLDDLRARMKSFGENVGMAFQIKDDLLDYVGRKSLLGKPTGADLKDKKITLPLIHALKTAPRRDARQALKLVKKGPSTKDVAWILGFVDSNNGIDYAERCAESYAGEARRALSPLPGGDAKHALEQFVTFVMERNS